MIQIKPKLDYTLHCPVCNSTRVESLKVAMEGVHASAQNVCLTCGSRFQQFLPVGHTFDYPFSYVSNISIPDKQEKDWVSPWLKIYMSVVSQNDVGFEKKVFKNCEQVVILNALDYLYGHALLKLFNAVYHLDHHKDLGLIVVAPKNLEWLVPDGCAEIWLTDLKVSEMYHRHSAIGTFIQSQIKRFRAVYLSNAFTHPDFTRFSMKRFTGVAPFDLQQFSRASAIITFVLREDRWWQGHPWESFAFRMLRKIGLERYGTILLCLLQNKRVKRLIRQIKAEIPEARFFISGLGNTGTFGDVATDLRKQSIDAEHEIKLCRVYAKSHIVIGIHGSNMILPTAHAAGCIEILPDERIGNIVQDIGVRYSDRRQLFLYRFVPQYCRPANICLHVAEMIRGYDQFYRNMCRNQYR